jgi:putative heme iron utilization protein
MPRPADPVAPADAEARGLARTLLQTANHAALAYASGEDGAPSISRIAFGLDRADCPMTLISALSTHFAGLRANPQCSVIAQDDPTRADLRAHWLKGHPKATLYVDFADFAFVRLSPQNAFLNGGFGRAFRFSAEDLAAKD